MGSRNQAFKRKQGTTITVNYFDIPPQIKSVTQGQDRVEAGQNWHAYSQESMGEALTHHGTICIPTPFSKHIYGALPFV